MNPTVPCALEATPQCPPRLLQYVSPADSDAPILHEVPEDVGPITQWEDGCRCVQHSKCAGFFFDRLAGCVYELGEMALTRKEVTRLAKLINVAGLEIKHVVLYHEDNSIFASINDGAKTWDLNMTHLTLVFVPFEPVASRNQRSIFDGPHLLQEDVGPTRKYPVLGVRSAALFSHAVRWELASGNPISSGITVGSGGKRGPSTGVRVSAKRAKAPTVLLPEQVRIGLTMLEFRDQLLVLLDGAVGTRRGELAALRWQDCDE